MPIAGSSTQRLFWAWYAAGVDTILCACTIQSHLVRHMFALSPVSLASQFSTAFHVTSDTTYA